MKVTQSNFKQPAFFSRITCNQDLIGKEEKYEFCSEGILDKFEKLIDLAKGLYIYSSKDMLQPVISNMSKETISPMTKNALETIAGKLNDIITRLDINPSKSDSKCEPLHVEHQKTGKELAQCLRDVVSLLMVDAHYYKVISSNITTQLRVSSREQFTSHDVEFIADSTHGSNLASVDDTTAASANTTSKSSTQTTLQMFSLNVEDIKSKKKFSSRKLNSCKSKSLSKDSVKSDAPSSKKEDSMSLEAKTKPEIAVP
jgi:hypothetical protein